MTTYLTIPIFLLVLITNWLWYSVKGILEENGYKVSYWHSHFRDLPNFWKLIKATENEVLKAKYKRLFWRLIISTSLFIIVGILMIIDFQRYINMN